MYNFGDEGNVSGTLTISVAPEPGLLLLNICGVAIVGLLRLQIAKGI
jgi:hypothetical protein